MSWRIVVISRRAKLELKMNYLVVRDDEVKRVHLSEISTIIIETTAASLTTSLLCELSKRKIKVIFCDERRNPSSELIPYYGAHDTSGKVREQVGWRSETKSMIWTEIITEKIRNQARVLDEFKKEESKLIFSYIPQILLRDESNREGHAAKVYFNALFGMDFTRTADNATNATLNYGYSILLSAFAREIVSAGYITQLGLFHDNQFNQFNLASDLMEPFRQLVDRKVYLIRPDEFSKEEKIEMINILNMTVEIAGRRQYVNNAIKIYCKSVFEALNEEDISEICFYRYEF